MIYPNVFYFNSISSIGGIESWFYYLSIIYKGTDVTIMYKNADNLQLNRIKTRYRCIKWNGRDRIECENLFVNFNREIIDYATVHNKIYLVLHGDYLDMVNRGQLQKSLIPLDSRVDEYIGVSKTVCDSWFKLTGIMPKLSYNPVVRFKPLKQLKLISAQRMSKEKGAERIERLITELDRYCVINDVEYVYDIYTNEYGNKKLDGIRSNKHINLKKSRLDVNRLYGNYDYLVSLSDNEGYCYTVVEALLQGTPCVVTPLPVFKEIGVNKTNSIMLAYDCSNVSDVVKEMFNTSKHFKYKPKETSYHEFLINKPNQYKVKEDEMAKIIALMNYKDEYEGKNIKKGDVYETTDERGKQITSATYLSRTTGLKTKYAEYTDKPINVDWQEAKKDDDVVVPAEDEVKPVPKKRGGRSKRITAKPE